VIVFGLLMVLVLQRFADGLWPRCSCCRSAGSSPGARPRAVASGVPLEQRALPAAGQVLLDARQVTPLRRPGGQQRGDLASSRRGACADRPQRRARAPSST
jgi:branched-chain amino acid transport system permease protein